MSVWLFICQSQCCATQFPLVVELVILPLSEPIANRGGATLIASTQLSAWDKRFFEICFKNVLPFFLTGFHLFGIKEFRKFVLKKKLM